MNSFGAFLLAVVFLVAPVVLASAGPKAGYNLAEEFVTIDVPGHERLTLRLQKQEARSLVRKDGTVVRYYSPENGLRIASALQAHGLDADSLLASVLLYSGAGIPRDGDESHRGERGYCAFLKMPDGATLEFHFSHPPEDMVEPLTRRLFRRFHAADAIEMKETLLSSGYGMKEVMQVWLGIGPVLDPAPGPMNEQREYVPKCPNDGPDFCTCQMPPCPFPDPPCNQCYRGQWVNIRQTCTTGTLLSCTVCTICP